MSAPLLGRAEIEAAAELGLPAWWLNDQASAYVSPTPDGGQRAVFNHPGLRVSVRAR